MCFQITQKIHVVSDLYELSDSSNGRACDVVDLLLSCDLAAEIKGPTWPSFCELNVAQLLRWCG
ncbi:hypothetical protein MLPF_0919 [Mycobacterium lepromatosis]|nr:hypothetical protein MLPF_0919 [Mycobacterium lepromatosis]